MNKRVSKLMRMNRSLGVILPKDWTRGMELEAGDEVELVYDGDVTVRVRRTKVEEGFHGHVLGMGGRVD